MRRLTLGFTFLLLFSTISPSPAMGAAGDPGDVTGSDPITGSPVWTGFKNLSRGVTVLPGSVLTIQNATVTFFTTPTNHFGIEVLAGGRLVVRDSLLVANGTGMPENERVKRYWNLQIEGVLDVARSEIRHAADITMERDGVTGSRIVDSRLHWMSRGIHVARTNITGHDAWDLELVNVSIRDLPNVGGGLSDIGGAIGVLNGNVRIDRVTIERGRGTGLFVDASAVAQQTNVFGNRVVATDLVILGGSPEGQSGEGKLLEVRTVGSFDCTRCTFIAETSSYLLFRTADRITMTDLTVVNGIVNIDQPEDYPLTFERTKLLGPYSGIEFLYGTQGTPTWNGLSFGTPVGRGVQILDDHAQDMRNAWWGAATGPRDTNPDDLSTPLTNDGDGQRIEGPVRYENWLSAPPPASGALRLALATADALTRPGAATTLPFTLQNAGTSAVTLDLSALSPMPATVTPETVTLAPGSTATGTLTYTVPATVAPGTPLHATVLAAGDGTHTSDTITTTAAVTRPTVAIDAPQAYAQLDGDVTLQGHVTEPLPLPGPEPSNVQASPLGPLDANGDRIDDRAQRAPGPVSVLIAHDGTAAPALTAALEEEGGQMLRAYDIVPVAWALVDSSTLPTLAATPGVSAIWWDEPLTPQMATAARAVRARTSTEGVLPGGAAPDATYPGVWSGNPRDGYQGLVGRGVLVAVIDSGLDPTHASIDDMDDDPATVDPKVAGRISTFSILATAGADIAPSSLVTPGRHGTSVAGAALGTGQGYLGDPDAPAHVGTPEDPWLHAGIAPGARVLDVDAYEEFDVLPHLNLGPAYVAPVNGVGLAMEGFQAVANWNRQHPDDLVRIVQISLSTGTDATDNPVNAAANALAATGVLVIVASGNNAGAVAVPSSASKVISVGATGLSGTVDRGDDYKARFSDTANADQQAAGIQKPDLMAPGVSILLPELGTVDGYLAKDGTSFAAPIVSGAAALVWEANPALHAAQVKEILIRSSEPRGNALGELYTDVDLDFEDDADDGGWDPTWGRGYLDVEEAVRLARATTPRTPPAAPLLTLHAHEGALTPDAPTTPAVAMTPTSFVRTMTEGLVLGDADVASVDAATLVVSAPTADPEPSVSIATVTLLLDGEPVARLEHVDNRASTATTPADTRLTLHLGRSVRIEEAGPNAGSVQHLATYDVLDERGDLLIPPGATLALDIALVHRVSVTANGITAWEEAPAPILTGTGGTRLIAPLDPVTLPNGEPPTHVLGLRARTDTTGVHLTWGPAGDDLGIASYQIARDGILATTVPASVRAWTDDTRLPLTTATYTVRAIDIHGAAGAWSDPLENAMPSATGRSLIVTLAGHSAHATDTTGDGTYATWTGALAVDRLGRHTLSATLYEDGEPQHTATRPLSIARAANLPPVVTLDAIEGLVHGLRTIAWTATDGNGDDDLVSIQHRIDDGPWTPVGTHALVLDARHLVDGPHTLTLRAIDTRGATATATRDFTTQAWTATLTAPLVLLEGAPTPVTLTLAGDGLDTAAPALTAHGVTTPFTQTDADTWSATLPPMSSGLATLRVQHGADTLTEATRIVDRPPQSGILGPTRGTRLDTLVLRDASIDDGGISQRTWTLPDDTPVDGDLLRLDPGTLGVGTHTITLTVTNVNGLTATATHTLTIENLAPVVTVSPAHVLDTPTDVIYAGEPVTLVIDISDPENDALTVTGGLTTDGTLTPLTPGRTTLTVRPLEPGTLALDLVADDTHDATPHTLHLDVLPNTAPIARLVAPATFDAGTPVTLDARLSNDPDRGWLTHAMTLQGQGTTATNLTTTTFPMGTWNVTHTVTDSSGATDTLTRTLLSDDWMSLTMQIVPPKDATSQGAIHLQARWHDGTPVADATVDVTLWSDLLPDLTRRTLTTTTGPDGTATLLTERDLARLHLPGEHTAQAHLRHDSLPDAPIQDLEEATATAHYLI